MYERDRQTENGTVISIAVGEIDCLRCRLSATDVQTDGQTEWNDILWQHGPRDASAIQLLKNNDVNETENLPPMAPSAIWRIL